MGWSYKSEKEAVADMERQMKIIEDAALDELEAFSNKEDDEIDTTDIYYKLIYVDVDEFEVLEKLEQKVNRFIELATDDFTPDGPPVQLGGYYVQKLIDAE